MPYTDCWYLYVVVLLQKSAKLVWMFHFLVVLSVCGTVAIKQQFFLLGFQVNGRANTRKAHTNWGIHPGATQINGQTTILYSALPYLLYLLPPLLLDCNVNEVSSQDRTGTTSQVSAIISSTKAPKTKQAGISSPVAFTSQELSISVFCRPNLKCPS